MFVRKKPHAIVVAAVFLIASQQASRAQLYQPTLLQQRCSKEADARGLHGIERKNFRAVCKQNGAQSPESATSSPSNDTVATPAAIPPAKQFTAKPITTPSTQPPTTHATTQFAAPTTERRVALVIGNSAYNKVPFLPNPVNDASDISQSLTRLGFLVRTATNASFDEMRRRLIAFGREAQGSDIAVVYFAGHGMEIGGENWLIPVDAELRSDTDTEGETISLKTVVLQVSKATKLGLVILDACRNNPFAAKMQRTIRVRSVDHGLVRTEPLDNVLVAYSAKDGTTANDGMGRNSPFTSALLRHIETPGLEIRFLFANVRDDVMAVTKREQQPFMYGSLSSERIYFRLPDETTPSETSKPVAVPKAAAKPAPIAAAKPTEASKPAAEPIPAAITPATTSIVFPSVVSPKYSAEDAGKARMHTCVDQYVANKATNSNGDLLWIQLGGGYYSECNKRLKGE
jgi:hypothetical protein